MAAQIAGKDRVTFNDFLQILRLRKALVSLLLTLVLVTTAGVTALLPRWYLSITKIRVEKPDGEVKLFQAQANNYYDPYFQQDQFRILQSEKILYPVIASLGLGEKLAADAGMESALSPAMAYRYMTEKMLRIDSQRSSSIIEIGVYSKDARLAASIANEIARVYEEDRIALATSEQRSGLAKLRQELEAQERTVSAQRDAVEKLRKDLNISGVDLNARYSDMEIETLRQMQNSLIALRVDAIGRKTRWERFRAIPAAERVSLVNSELIQDPNIQNLLQAYLVADQTVSRLRARLGEAHPDLIAATESRAKMKEQLDVQLKGYESALEISFNEAQARVTELENQLARAKVDQILSAREKLRPFEEAVQRLEDETRLLTTLKLTLRQREIDFQVPKKTIEILNQAEPALYYSRPNWIVNLSAALFFGMLLGVGAALALEYFDTSFRSVADVEEKLRLSTLGVIPLSENPEEISTRDLAASEPYRVLHTNLNLLRAGAKGRALMLCSAGPGEGKSTTLHHLAALMAATGERVVLVDSDLRRPVQHHFFNCPRSPGLAEFLQGQASLEQILRAPTAEAPAFIPAGASTETTLGLPQQEKLRELLAALRTRFDTVLFDSPPIIGVSDASVLASSLDGVLLVVQYRRNPQSMVLRAKQILDGLKAPVLGVVLNQVPSGSGEDYAYYTANYEYYGESRKSRRDRKRKGTSGTSGERIDLDEKSDFSKKI